MKGISTNLQDWDNEELANASNDLKKIVQRHGMIAFLDAVESHKMAAVTQLASMAPTDNAAEYASIVGKIQALEEVPLILQGLIQEGENAETVLRAQQENDLGS